HLPLVGDEVLRKVESQVEPTPYVEGTGELAGGLVGYGLPWYGLEETIGGAATKFGLPWLASKAILPQALRGAGAGYVLGKATGEDAETMAKIGAVAPFVGYAIARLGGAGLRKLGSIFTRPGAEEPVEPEFSRVKPEPEPEPQEAPPEPTTTGTAPAPEPPAPEGPIPKPATSISGEVSPAFPKAPVAVEPAGLSEAEMRAKIKADIDIRMKRAKLKARNASDAALAEAGLQRPSLESDEPGALIGT